MKKLSLLKTVLLLCALVVGSVNGWAAAEVYTHTFTRAELTSLLSKDGELADDEDATKKLTWSFTAKHGDSDVTLNNGDARGVQIGSGNTTNSCRTMTLSTASVSGSITKIVVIGGLAKSGSGTINAKVDGSDFGGKSATQNLVASGSETGTYTFEGDATGTILITMSQPSTDKAMYLKSIEITYSDDAAVEKPTFSPDGGVITEATTVTISAGEGCTVYYTTDGTTPTTLSTSGTSVVIPASGTTTLKAIAVDGEGNESGVATAEYVYKDPTMVYEEKTSFSSGQTSGTLETLIIYASYQGGAGNAPAIYNNGIRLYQKSGTNDYGGYVTMTAPEGYKITGFEITSTNTYATTVDYTVDGSDEVGEGEALPKSSKYSKDGLFNSSVSVFNLGSGSSGRLEIASIKVYYTSSVASVTISDAEYATYCNSSKILDFKTAGIQAFIAKDNGSTISLTEITNGEVPANTPVILYKEGANGTAINVPVIASTTTVIDDDDNDLVVSDGTTAKGDDVYVLAKNPTIGFYKWTSASSLSEGKIYLKAAAALGREFIGFDGETTGIESVKAACTMKGEYFNLNGQRVAQPTKGLYIVNGKKVVIK